MHQASVSSLLREEAQLNLQEEAERSQAVAEAASCKQQIDAWGSMHDINYGMWSLLLQAEISFVLGDYPDAGLSYEQAIDFCQMNGCALEEALALELQAEFLLAKGVKRAGIVLIREAIAAYNRINAVGKGSNLPTSMNGSSRLSHQLGLWMSQYKPARHW